MGTTSYRRARRRAHHVLSALVATLLLAGFAAPLTTGAAYAGPPEPEGVLDPLLGFLKPIEPVMSGAGSISTLTPGLVCSNLDGAPDVGVTCSDPLSLLDLAGLTTVVLTAVPADGWQFAGWTGCTSTSGADCILKAAKLGGVLGSIAPVARFEKLPIDPCTVTPDLPVCADTTPPDTKLTKTPTVTAGRTSATVAAFTFTTATPEAGASFECRLTMNGTVLVDWQNCTTPPAPAATTSTGAKTYDALRPAAYTFEVRARDGRGNTDTTPALFTWTVTDGAPQTSITRGPGGWVLTRKATFGYAADRPTQSFGCTLDGRPVPCSGSATTVSGYAAGTHVFGVAAKDLAGTVDATPARRTFTLPRNNTALTASKGWRKRTGSGYFLKSCSATSTRGATLSTKASSIRSVALVVSKGRGYGVVKVYLGRTLLKTVSLASPTGRSRQVVPVATFSSPKRGTIRVVVASSGKQVVVEGLGIASR